MSKTSGPTGSVGHKNPVAREPGVRASTLQGETVVLGLDPGTLVTGYGIVARRGNEMMLVDYGTIRNEAESTMAARLQRIHVNLAELIARHHPVEFAIESAFYGKNAQSALKLGHARGVSILAAVQAGLATSEYSPREVKKAIVGTGTASKEQVRYMVCSLLHIRDGAVPLDASDALAVAICHLHSLSPDRSRHHDWASYVAAHPERVAR